MGELCLSKDLYNEEFLNLAINDFKDIAKISLKDENSLFKLNFDIISEDEKSYIIDEYCNYVLGLMR